MNQVWANRTDARSIDTHLNPRTNTPTMSSNNFNGSAIVRDLKSPEVTGSLAILMDKIRKKAVQYRGWPELIKITKNTLVDKRSPLVSDSNERSQVERALDTMQRNIKVTGLRSMVERLETVTRQLGLKFHPGPTGEDVFISSDMFYVEVKLDPDTGYVKDVMIAHQTDPVPCHELTMVLRNSDFAEFTRHLEGISAIYQPVADKKQKTNVTYLAMHSLETDLQALAHYQTNINDPNNIIHKTPVGILEPRKGGHPMKLTFFVSPYDLIDRKAKNALTLNADVVIEKKLGYSATVCIESADRNYKLQTKSLISVSKSADGKTLPQFAALSNLNSSSLPACFVLKLTKPLPISLEILNKISSVTSIEFAHRPSYSLIHLIAYSILNERDRNKLAESVNLPSGMTGSDSHVNGSTNGHTSSSLTSYHVNSISSLSTSGNTFHVKLPDQEHCYFIHQGSSHLNGAIVTSIPFIHPTHVPQILVFLRQQVLFNVIVGSCIRKLTSFSSGDTKFSFEVMSSSMSNITVSFEHPVEESLASLEIDLKDITNVKCKLYDPASFSNLCTDEFASRIMQRCLSIPVTLRMVILKSREKAAVLREQEIRAQQQQQQQQHNDLYSYSMGASNSGIESSISSLFSPNLFSNIKQNTNGIKSEKNDSPDHSIGIQSHASMQLNHLGTQNFAFDHQQQVQAHTNAMAKAQVGKTNIANNVQSQLKQAGLANHTSPQRGLVNQKSNAMLLNMLSDVPAANSAQANYASYQAQQQQLHQQQQQAALHAQIALQQQQDFHGSKSTQNTNPALTNKKTRKRKNGENSNLVGPGKPFGGTMTGRSPKRKMSEDDFNSNPSNEYLVNSSMSENHIDMSSRPSSTASSFDLSSTSNTPRSLEQLLSAFPSNNSQSPSTSAHNDPYARLGQQASFNDPQSNEILTNYQFLQRSLSAGPLSGLDVPDETDDANTVKVSKKRSTRLRSSDEAIDDSGLTSIIKSLDGKNKAVQSALATSARGSSGDGRRCSSAGIGEGRNPRSSPFNSNSLLGPEETILLKKERKRKRSESVDSIKPVGSLMPPPGSVAVDSIPASLLNMASHEIASSSGHINSAVSIASTSASTTPALRPLTLNVKSMMPSSTTSNDAPLSIKSPSKKANSLLSGVTSSAPSASPSGKLKSDKSLKMARVIDTVNGSITVASASTASAGIKIAKHGLKFAKNGAKFVASSGKMKQGGIAATKFKNSQVSSSSSLSAKSSVVSGSSMLNAPSSVYLSANSGGNHSPPVSSSSTSTFSTVGQASSSISSSPSSKVKQQQVPQAAPTNSSQANLSGIGVASTSSAAPKRTKGSLSAVIDKLSKNVSVTGEASSSSAPSTSPVSGSENASNSLASSSSGPSKPESSSGSSSMNKPDSSSNNGAKAGGKFEGNGNNGLKSKFKDSSAQGVTSKITATASGGIKLTISKRPASSTEPNSKLGLKIRSPANAGARGSPASSSTLKKSSSSLIKKHSAIGTPVYKSTLKASSSGVSSSSSNLTSPKVSGSSISPKVSTANASGAASSGRTGSGKVSSSGSKDNISSSSGVHAILQEAIPKMRLDSLPKIPKTERAAQAAAQAAQAAASNASTSNSNAPASSSAVVSNAPSNVTGPSSSFTSSTSSSSTNSSNSQSAPQSSPFFRRINSKGPQQPLKDPQPLNFHARNENSNPGVDSTDRFQSNAITSSQFQAPHVQSIYPLSNDNAPIISSSANDSGGSYFSSTYPMASLAQAANKPHASGSSPDALVGNSSVAPIIGSSSALYANPISANPNTHPDTNAPTVGGNLPLANVRNDKGVTSSSDATPGSPTSTPSSPAECASFSQSNPPPIIPTESFDDSDDRISSSPNLEASTSGSAAPSVSSAVGPSDHRANNQPASAGDKVESCSSTSVEASGHPTNVCGSSSLDPEEGDDSQGTAVKSSGRMSKSNEEDLEDEDDEDGLIIDVDFATSGTPVKRDSSETPTPSDSVTSSNAAGNSANNGNCISGQSSPSPPSTSSAAVLGTVPQASSASSTFSWPSTSAAPSDSSAPPSATPLSSSVEQTNKANGSLATATAAAATQETSSSLAPTSNSPSLTSPSVSHECVVPPVSTDNKDTASDSVSTNAPLDPCHSSGSGAISLSVPQQVNDDDALQEEGPVTVALVASSHGPGDNNSSSSSSSALGQNDRFSRSYSIDDDLMDEALVTPSVTST